MRPALPFLALLAALLAAPLGGAQQPAASGSLGLRILLGAPTASGIALSTAFDAPARWFYRYGTSPDALGSRTAERTATGGKAEVETLAGLAPATAYWYRLVTAEGDGWREGPLGRFVTQRPPGASFTCVIEADPHLDENSSAAVYAKVLDLMVKDLPDFAIDLGDASMAEKLASTTAGYEERNRLVRSFWDDIGHSVPFLMVLGNHDGEHGWASTGGKPASGAAAAIRRAWFPNPVPGPGSIYAGIGDTAYAFTWGDALFVVLDPYTWTLRKSPTDNWAWTLGRAQYDWLAATLAAATARYRFVFIHHLVGGMGKDTRGGADWAPYFEWGGRNPDGTDGFADRRPGWDLPIHDLLVQGKVDVVFHGHDHFYAREERDGIVYLEVPQPSAAREVDTARSAADYGYSTGTFFSSPGYLRLSVSPARAAIELVRGTGGTVADTVIITP